jgi:hypothetical protein
MKMLVKRMVLATSVALATLIVAEAANAQEYLPQESAYAQGHQTTSSPRMTAPSNGVMSGNRQIGRDPDPFIREEMLRHSDSGWPD